ncbi:hypothetical protein SCA6_014465, partial [Theobroma cacao]
NEEFESRNIKPMDQTSQNLATWNWKQICPAGVVKMLSDCSYVAAASECLSVCQKAKKRIAGGLERWRLEIKDYKVKKREGSHHRALSAYVFPML